MEDVIMDYSEIYSMFKQLLEAQEIDISCVERHETLYYDESGNSKHLLIKDNGELNSEEDSMFVLGGVQAENPISMDELKSFMKKDANAELKANKDLRGSFTDILRKEHFKNILSLIDSKGWNIHFDIVSILYYGFVEIIDSIKGTEVAPVEMKAVLYEVLKNNITDTVNLFKKYKYPDIEEKNKKAFLDGINNFIEKQIQTDAGNLLLNPILLVLKAIFENAKKQKELTFIQDEKPNIWVDEFVQFYRQEIINFPNKTLIFDEEKQVQGILAKEVYEIDGKVLSNYSFDDSGKNPMIQVSDYVVSILRKYFIFLDRKESEVESELKALDDVQSGNFRLLNKVLRKSVEYNPVFFHFTSSIHTKNKFDKYLNEYGS